MTEAQLIRLRSGHLSPILPHDARGDVFKAQVTRLAQHVGVAQVTHKKAGFDPKARLKEAMDSVKEGVKKGYAYQLNDLKCLDELIYRTSTVAYDTCLAARPQPKRRFRQAAQLTPGPEG